MITKYTFGKPFNTESVVDLPAGTKCLVDQPDLFAYGFVTITDKFEYNFRLNPKDRVYGLGQTVGGINKRGKIYESWCNDDPSHTEEKKSLYGAHNFFIIDSKDPDLLFGLYFDYPSKLVIDAGYTRTDRIFVKAESPNMDVYVIEPEINCENKILSIVEQFRKMIGKSYTPPLWAFGYMQSRWGYGTEQDLETVYKNHKEHNIPLDAIFLDIDYMDGFKDFTINKNNFKDFKTCIQNMKQKNVHIVPIIDAGIKADPDFDIDKEGLEKGHFCKKADGTPFAAGVWPGLSHFTDFLNPEARKWFGSKYQTLLDDGIDGFWNDMNEPALFYSEDGIKETYKKVREKITNENPDVYSNWEVKDSILALSNNQKDYESFYHRVPAKDAGAFGEGSAAGADNSDGTVLVRHDKVHNLYGYNMTRAAAEYFKQQSGKDILLISRASYIGMHRYSGIWTGDNYSWWSHILLVIKQLPSLNMCGFLYTGCDLGGFGCNTSRDLLLRFLSIGVFTPLMRNHSALGTREQECYKFENPEDFRGIISLRYRLLPYLYTTYKKCVEENKMYFKPLCFDYPNDPIAPSIEDQLILGEDLMIAPVYTQNAQGRTVYLPENMTCVTCGLGTGLDTGKPVFKKMKKGVHFIEVPLNKIVFFIKKGHKIPVTKAAFNTAELNFDDLEMW